MRLIAVLIILCGTLTCMGKINYKKFLEQYDVDAVTMNLPNANTSDFWLSYLDNNETFKLFQNKIGPRGNLHKKANEIIENQPRFSVKYSPSVIEEYSPLCDGLKELMGINKNVELCIVDDPSINAFSTYGDEGMVMAVHSGVLSLKAISRLAMMACDISLNLSRSLTTVLPKKEVPSSSVGS